MGSIEPPGSSSVIQPSSTPTYIGARELNFHHAAGSLWMAFAVNITIALIKYIAWTFSGSPAVLSESLHSFGDGVNSVALIIGNKLSKRPPDRTHPFGYGLEANLWTIPACVLLAIFALLAIWEGWQRLSEPQLHEQTQFIFGMTPFLFSVVVLTVSVGLEILAVHRASQAVLEELSIEAHGVLDTFRKALGNIRLVVAPTTRFVFYEDMIALTGALLALIAISLSHFAVDWGILPVSMAHYPDSGASILIGGMLIGMSLYLFKHNRGVLTQTAASPNVEKRISEMVSGMQDIMAVLDLKTIDHGLAGLTVHLQVQVNPYTQVKDVDDLTERVKQRIQSRIPNVSKVFVEVLADESEIEWSEKFETLIRHGQEEEVLDDRAATMLRNVYDFTEATVRDIMIPRIDVEFVEVDTPLCEVADLMIETGHSRLPVYKENVDDLVGLVHSRDVFEKIHTNQLSTPLSTLVREIDIYPENKPISDLLEDFKRKKIRIAAVADEHGGFAGLVTVEDVIEEIIGEIWDEHEDEAPMITLLEANKVQVNGKCDIEDVNEALSLNMPFDEFKTVGGFVFGLLGREPEVGDEVAFEDLKLLVEEADGPRIVSVLIESPVPFEPKPSDVEVTGNGHNGDSAEGDTSAG